MFSSRIISRSCLRVASRSRALSAIAVPAAKTTESKHHHHLTALTLAAATVLVVTTTPPATKLHCQVPCGIFDDPVRVTLLKENAATIKKAMLEIDRLSEHGAPSGEQFSSQDINQVCRWIVVKEDAANEIMTIVSDYMLAQRVKKASFASEEEYHRALEIHHVLLQCAMKAKQTVDLDAYLKLEHAIADVGAMYTK